MAYDSVASHQFYFGTPSGVEKTHGVNNSHLNGQLQRTVGVALINNGNSACVVAVMHVTT